MVYVPPRRPRLKAPTPDRRQPDNSTVRHRALAFLAGCLDSCAETLLLVNGFTVDLMVEVVRDGLASATPERVVSAERQLRWARVRITEAGRKALKAAIGRRLKGKNQLPKVVQDVKFQNGIEVITMRGSPRRLIDLGTSGEPRHPSPAMP
jgi:hypothetical protein